MGPLEILYSWQALLCAAACVGLTRLVRSVIDASIGPERRKGSYILSQFILPMTPIWIGAAFAIAVPAHPDVIRAYLEGQSIEGLSRLMILAAWGGACGQFATYLYERAERLIQATK